MGPLLAASAAAAASSSEVAEARPELNDEVAKALSDVRASVRHVEGADRHVEVLELLVLNGDTDERREEARQYLTEAKERLREAKERLREAKDRLREAKGEPAAASLEASAGPAAGSADSTIFQVAGIDSEPPRDQGLFKKVDTDMHLALERSSANSDAGIAGGAPDVDTCAESLLLGDPPVASISAGGLRKRVGGWGLLRF